MEALCFYFFQILKYRVTKGFKFHARPQTGAKSDKVATNNNNNKQQTTNNKQQTTNNHFLCQKVFLRPILQNLKGRSVLDNFFLKMILSTSQIRCHQAKNSISSGSWSKTQNGGQNRIYPSLTDRKIFPFKKGF